MESNTAFVSKIINIGIGNFDLKNPTFDKSVEFVYKAEEKTLFLPVPNKYLKGKDVNCFTVRIGIKDDKYIIINVVLKSATSQEDIDYVFDELVKDWRWDKEKAKYCLYDKRTGKPRSHRCKLKIEQIIIYKDGVNSEFSLAEN